MFGGIGGGLRLRKFVLAKVEANELYGRMEANLAGVGPIRLLA